MQIVWDGPMNDGRLIVRDIYRILIASSYRGQMTMTFLSFWRRKIPTKIVLFGSLVWKGKILTGENLIKRGYCGPFRCVICCGDFESTSHLFFRCPAIVGLWRLFTSHFLDPGWLPDDFISSALEWDKLRGKYKSLPFFIWEVWLGRNKSIFEDVSFQIPRIFSAIKRWMDDRPSPFFTSPSFTISDGSIRIQPHEMAIPAIYFDGACVDGVMGCGAWIKLSQRERIHIYWNGGPESNNKAEIIAL